MACAPGLMAAEAAYLDGARRGRPPSARVADLVLTGHGRRAALPAGRRGAHERADRHRLGAGDPAGRRGRELGHRRGRGLRFEADGTFTGTTACHTLSARWQPTGDDLRFPEFTAAETDCPAEARTQDEHELAVLGDGFQLAIEENRLTAMAADGRGLIYRDEGTG